MRRDVHLIWGAVVLAVVSLAAIIAGALIDARRPATEIESGREPDKLKHAAIPHHPVVIANTQASPEAREDLSPPPVSAAVTIDQPTVEREAQRVLGAYMGWRVSSDTNLADRVVEMLEASGIEVDTQNPDLMERIERAADLARSRADAYGAAIKWRVDAIADSLDAEGKATVIAPGARPPPVEAERPYSVYTRNLPDGSRRRYLIDAKTFPEHFADEEQQAREIAESLFSESIAAVREAGEGE